MCLLIMLCYLLPPKTQTRNWEHVQPYEDLRNVRSCLRMLAPSFLDIRVLLLHFIGLSRFLCYAF